MWFSMCDHKYKNLIKDLYIKYLYLMKDQLAYMWLI
jgi:hypothetical protein